MGGGKPNPKLKDFGFEPAIIDIAEAGIFDKPDITPIESVRDANFYEFMNTLRIKIIQSRPNE